MNTSYFLLVSVALTFATGFFVASIIYGISWFLTPKEERTFAEGWSSIFRHQHKEDSTKDLSLANSSHRMAPDFEESEYNKELYHYHHGEN